MKPITFRISNISRSITKREFEHVLISLAKEGSSWPNDADGSGLLGWSCTPSGHSEQSFTATATFRIPPAPSQLESAIMRTTSGDSTHLRVDMDFFGLTPLAHPRDAAVE